jgi:ribosome-binding ATPase YchF (GTP1/OBG family)
MQIGIIGAPNKGKSTLFSALTLNDVAIADYPFTTIDPNIGVAYATSMCVEKELSVKCRARNSLCVDGTRMLPINIIDVAGLVEGAHEGKGMGNQFLNDLAAADAYLIVVDASGKTAPDGTHSSNDSNPVDDVMMVERELTAWLGGMVKKHMNIISRNPDGVEALYSVLAGLKVSKESISTAIEKSFLTSSNIAWGDGDIETFSRRLLSIAKPVLIVANKSDSKEAEQHTRSLIEKFGEKNVVACSAAIELALRKAANRGVISYKAGDRSFELLKGDISQEQKSALEYMKDFVARKGTNVQEVINRAVFGLLNEIVVYPVEDENKYTDHFGNVLPDAILIQKGATAYNLAERIHTDIAKSMLYAVDAKAKMRIGKDYLLKNDDVIKIVTSARPK